MITPNGLPPMLVTIKCAWEHRNVPRASMLPLTVMPCIQANCLTVMILIGVKPTTNGAN